jgi:hypothetical protein
MKYVLGALYPDLRCWAAVDIEVSQSQSNQIRDFAGISGIRKDLGNAT